MRRLISRLIDLRVAVTAMMLIVAPIGCGDDDFTSFEDDGGVPNTVPVPEQERITIRLAEDTSVDIDPKVTDADDDPLSYRMTAPQHGTLTRTTPPFVYNPDDDYTGSDSFDITVSDGTIKVTIAVELTITPVNDAPVATDATVSVEQGSPTMFRLAATDRDSETLTYTVVSGPAYGGLDGTAPVLIYNPERFHFGEDSITFTASDGTLDSEVATVTFRIEHVITCGDGMVEEHEACDDGNQVDTDACRNSCALVSCGDEVVGPGEQCEDGNQTDTDACRNNCMKAACGDGVVQAGEEACDDGNDVDTDACRNDCTPAECGDGFVQAGVEPCDDGNDVDTDDCRNGCLLATCGDGVVEAGVEPCDDGDQDDTDDCRNNCMVAACGDGVVRANVEACDDGNDDNGDGCLDTCVVAACGDGFVEAGVEECDDANADNDDACLDTCVAAGCGDGFVQAGIEQCDDANGINGDACLNTCAVARCGDGVVQSGVEACDDGNQSNGDACLNTCAAAGCGDGFVQTGVEGCDDANQSNADACLNTCVAAGCGDGFVQTGVEACDDANQLNTDACLNTCVAAGCGDGFVQAGVEACDDANQSNTDACLNTCAVADCSDGFVQTGVETCDDGNQSNTDACLNTCAAASCGDGFVEAGIEQCDDANSSDDDACLSTCVAAACGDGFVQDGVEQCDDANDDNTDACLDVCAAAACGDGFVEAGVEQCDDANEDDADACLSDCTVPCGNGALDDGEECDDSNTADGDGCGHSCLVERCGDGLTQFFRSEQCDDANLSDGDGCDAACQAEPFFTTAAVNVSAGPSCTTATANAGRKVAVDGSGTVYVVMQCGTSANVVVSTDRGLSFSAPVDLSVDLPDAPVAVAQVAVSAPLSGVAFVAMMVNTGEVYLRATSDGGATWEPAVAVGAASNISSGLSLESFNDDVYVGFATSGGVAVARNHTAGIGTFDITPVAMSVSFFDVFYDVVQGTVVVAADTPGFHVRVSSDAAVLFAAEANPPGQQFYSDWAIGNGNIFAVGINLGAMGDSSRLYIIPSSDVTTSTFVAGLPVVTTPQSRTVAADTSGNAFVASQLDGGGVQLDRLAIGSTVFDAPRLLHATASSPIAAPLPGSQGVAVAYTIGSDVWVTIQTY